MVTGGYKGLQTCVCRRSVYNKAAILSYPILSKELQGVTKGTGDYKGLQGVTEGDK